MTPPSQPFSMTSRSSASTDDGGEAPFEPGALESNNNFSVNGYGSGGSSCSAGLKSRPSSGRSRRQSSVDRAFSYGHNGYAAYLAVDPGAFALTAPPPALSLEQMAPLSAPRKSKRSSWSITLLVFVTASLGVAVLFAILRSVLRHQVETKGCRMSYMRPSYIHFSSFDTEHTRFATKYSLYLYREQGIDDDKKVSASVLTALWVRG